MVKKKKAKKHDDKCTQCGTTDSENFWDYGSGQTLCDKCENKKSNPFAKKEKKSNFWIYIIATLVLFAVIGNLYVSIILIDDYATASSIQNEYLQFEDGSSILKTDYLNFALIDTLSSIVLFVLTGITLILIIRRHKFAVKLYAVSVGSAIIINFAYGNYSGAGAGFLIGTYVYNYLKNREDYFK